MMSLKQFSRGILKTNVGRWALKRVLKCLHVQNAYLYIVTIYKIKLAVELKSSSQGRDYNMAHLQNYNG